MKLKNLKIILPEPVLAYWALKSAKVTLKNERLVKVTVSELTLSAMSKKLKKIELPKPIQTTECKLANDRDSEWRKCNLISRADKTTVKNKHLMNVVLEQGEPFWLDFEHGVSERQTSEFDQTK